ncbi:hypothetical protein [Jannaschia sp. AI_61]|uniref:hypothetical protein n=1 Tax=Jannaschia sp. AI_61 TaxID=2829796 RepID=UPI001C7DAB71|nr:hypothetical protein [Jannaschia sp. AI_61]
MRHSFAIRHKRSGNTIDGHVDVIACRATGGCDLMFSHAPVLEPGGKAWFSNSAAYAASEEDADDTIDYWLDMLRSAHDVVPWTPL